MKVVLVMKLNDCPDDEKMRGGIRRRDLARSAAGAFVLAASGLLLPEWLEQAEAREGAFAGRLGGRRG